MATGIEEILKAALNLPSDSRAELAEKLLESLDEEKRAEIEESWVEEIERRWTEFETGKMKAIPGEEVMRSLRAGRKR